ncbi:uncharacterized protein LOC135411998 [Pseudopipra pipra]|uniref:uncharacterized protein LOC135411998 n=1 Tax=Pseudopipra pipra TaxID=415032 RepID=UPI003138F4D7
MDYPGKWCPEKGPTEAHTKGGWLGGNNSGVPGEHRSLLHLSGIHLQAFSSSRRGEADLRPIFDNICRWAADQRPPASPALCPGPGLPRAQPRPRADKDRRLVPRPRGASSAAAAAASPPCGRSSVASPPGGRPGALSALRAGGSTGSG